jgi:hypothetical protein
MKYAGRSGAHPADRCGAAFHDKWSKDMPHNRLSLQGKIFLGQRHPGYPIIRITREYPEEFYNNISQEKDRQKKKFSPGSRLRELADYCCPR